MPLNSTDKFTVVGHSGTDASADLPPVILYQAKPPSRVLTRSPRSVASLSNAWSVASFRRVVRRSTNLLNVRGLPTNLFHTLHAVATAKYCFPSCSTMEAIQPSSGVNKPPSMRTRLPPSCVIETSRNKRVWLRPITAKNVPNTMLFVLPLNQNCYRLYSYGLSSSAKCALRICVAAL
jgi:hypothetical protein